MQTKEEKFRELNLLYSRLDYLDRQYEMTAVMGGEKEWKQDHNQTHEKINQINSSLTEEEHEEFYQRD